MPIRKRGQAEATRQDLLETATAFFVRDGFEGTRIDAIAEAARVNKRMIYVYFGSKEALYLAVLHDQLDRVVQIARITEVTSDDPREEAEQIIRRYFDFLASNPRFVRLVNWEFLGETRAAREVFTSRALQGLEALHGVLEAGKRRGQFRRDLDVRRTVLSINSILLGQFTHQKLVEALWREDLSLPEAREATLQQVLAFVFVGIANPQPPRRDAPARKGKSTSSSKHGARRPSARRAGVAR